MTRSLGPLQAEATAMGELKEQTLAVLNEALKVIELALDNGAIRWHWLRGPCGDQQGLSINLSVGGVCMLYDKKQECWGLDYEQGDTQAIDTVVRYGGEAAFPPNALAVNNMTVQDLILIATDVVAYVSGQLTPHGQSRSPAYRQRLNELRGKLST